MSGLSIGGGLDNLGNTCFFNATLQSILHTRALATILTQHLHSSSCRLSQLHQWCCFCELETVFAATRHAKRYSPSKMIKNLKSIFKKFKLGRQQDSHQFLRYLIEGMQDAETGKAIKDGKEGKESASKENRQALEGRIRSSRVFGVFGAIMKTCVDCLNCNHKSITCERYYDFNIECQRSSTLMEGIASFFAVDKLEGHNKYLCEHCKIRSNARKRFLLDSVPQVATFQLKRFTNSLRKIGKFISFPLTIDLGRYLEIPRKVLMKLYAIVVHAGGSSYSGHYYAFVRVGENWFKMDDGYVSKCSQESVLSQNAYLLFYEKIFEEEIKIIPEAKKVEEEVKKPAQVKKNVTLDPVTKLNGIQPKQKQEPVNKSGIKLNGLIVNEDDDDDDEDDEDYSSGEEEDDDQSEDQDGKEGFEKPLLNGVLNRMAEPNHIEKNNNNPQQKHIHDDWSPQEDKEQKKQTEIQVPNGLHRRRSKQDMEKSITTQQLIMRAVDKFLDLRSKMPRHRPHNITRRHIYNLRKYETAMLKKRKIG